MLKKSSHAYLYHLQYHYKLLSDYKIWTNYPWGKNIILNIYEVTYMTMTRRKIPFSPCFNGWEILVSLHPLRSCVHLFMVCLDYTKYYNFRTFLKPASIEQENRNKNQSNWLNKERAAKEERDRDGFSRSWHLRHVPLLFLPITSSATHFFCYLSLLIS